VEPGSRLPAPFFSPHPRKTGSHKDSKHQKDNEVDI
jgi:hypothetical protein